jgi:hypothetical protein
VLIIAGVALVAIIAIIVVAWLASRRQVRGYLVDLFGRRAQVVTALDSVTALLDAMADGAEGDALAFCEPESDERQALSEIGARMLEEAEELQGLRLPRRLWLVADAVQHAASALAVQLRGVGGCQGDEALRALGELELTAVRESLVTASVALDELRTAYNLSDEAVPADGFYV